MKKRVMVISVILFGFFMIMAMSVLIMLALLFGNQSGLLSRLTDDKIAVIEITGLINESDEYIELLQQNVDNRSVQAIVLRINSPGGMVGASQEIYQAVTTARANGEIIITSMGDVAASGAYYIASGSNKIIANPGTLTGGIGVIAQFVNWEGLMGDKLGLRFHVIKSGEYKDTGSPNRPMTKEEEEYLQNVIDNVYSQFFDAVVEGRDRAIRYKLAKQIATLPDLGDPTDHLIDKNLSEIAQTITTDEIRNHIKPYAKGNIFTGEQAYQYGLVDKLGNLDTAVKIAAELAGIVGEPYVLRVKPRQPNIFNQLFGEAAQILNPAKRNNISLKYVLWF